MERIASRQDFLHGPVYTGNRQLLRACWGQNRVSGVGRVWLMKIDVEYYLHVWDSNWETLDKLTQDEARAEFDWFEQEKARIKAEWEVAWAERNQQPDQSIISPLAACEWV